MNTYSSIAKPTEDDKPQEREKRVEKIISGKISEAKPAPMKTFLKMLFADDIKEIKSHFIWEVLAPEIRTGIYNASKDLVDMIFLGSTRKRNSSSIVKPKVSYSNSSVRQDTQSSVSSARQTPEYEDILFDSISDAHDVLDTMIDIIERYGHVTVADFYDLIDKECKWTENKYGWTNLGAARVKRVHGGYIIEFPKATLI